MRMTFDVPTAYLLLGVLCVVGSLGVHFALSARGRAQDRRWVIAALALGACGLLLSLRPQLPGLLSFELAHAALVLGLGLHAAVLREERGRPLAPWVVPLLALGSVVIFAVLRRIAMPYGHVYALVVAVGGDLAIVSQAFLLWCRRRQPGAAIIGLAYWLLLLGVAFRAITVAQGGADVGPFDSGLDQWVMVGASMLAVTLGHIGYVGLQFERMAGERVASERQAAMQAERIRQTQLREAALRELLEERNQLIQRIARSEAASDLAQFATTLPHELSQPLCANRLHLEGLAEHLAQNGNDAQTAGVIRCVTRNNERVTQLLEQLRILMRAHEDTDREPIDLVALVHDTLPILDGTFRDASIRLEPVLPLDAVTVQAHSTQLQQLLLILCTHAFERLRSTAQPVDAVVRVALCVQGAQACLRVEASGGGLPVATRRVDSGLAIARRIAETHHGQLEVDGAGRFSLCLPRVPGR